MLQQTTITNKESSARSQRAIFRSVHIDFLFVESKQPLSMYTTNEEDQQKAAELKARLAADNDNNDASTASSTWDSYQVPSVTIDEGANKYVLIRARKQGSQEDQHFVVSSRGAAYHRDAAEPMIYALQRSGYGGVEVLGGGRIELISSEQKISIFGFSYGFGQADHNISARIITADPRYKDYKVSTSDAGY